MSIQFTCPSCNNPIEVDDEWAGHNVACPYCKNAVAAPNETTYTPAGPAFQARPATAPDQASTIATPPATGNPFAVWGFAISLTAVASFLATTAIMMGPLHNALGDSPTPQEVNQFLADSLTAPEGPARWLVSSSLMGCFGVVQWVVGLVLSVIGLRHPARRRMAITGLVLSCFLPMMIVLSAISG